MILAEGTGLEPASDQGAVVFGTTALPVRLPFRIFPAMSRAALTATSAGARFIAETREHANEFQIANSGQNRLR